MQTAPEINPGMIQEIATKCVVAYVTSGIPLSNSIAKESKLLQLNSEQVKRVIEAANTIAYLRLLKENTDRTFEFPVATFKEVMKEIALPAAGSPVAQVDSVTGETGIDKQASEQNDLDFISTEEKQAYLIKKARALFDEVDRLEVESCVLAEQFVKAAQEVSKDPLAFEKIAFVSGENAEKLSLFCSLEKSASEKSHVFTNADLEGVIRLNGLYKAACNFQADLKLKKDTLTSLMEKEAFLQALGRGIGSLAATPFRMGASAVKYTGTQVGRGVGAAGTHVGRKLGMVPPPPPNAPQKTIFGMKPSTIGKAAFSSTALGTAVMAPTLTHTNDVWSSLQG